MIGPQRLLRFKIGKTPADRDRLIGFLVRAAYDNVPYYRTSMDEAGIRPSGVRCVADLRRLPVTTKEALLDTSENGFLHRRAVSECCHRVSTSGYSGVPLTIYYSQPEGYYRRATLLLAMKRNAKLSWPVSLLHVGSRTGGGKRDVVQRLGLVRVIKLRRDLPIAEQTAAVRGIRAQIVEGTPSYLELLAEELIRQSIAVPRPRLVVTFGEILHNYQVALLEAAFGTRAANYYNCEEIGNIAWMCPLDRDVLHVNHDTCVLEIVGENGAPVKPGEEGRVLLTSLFGMTMPFLRYEVGDRARLLPMAHAPCACGHRGDSISLEVARDEDFFILPDGERISPRRPVAVVLGAALRTRGLTDVFADVIRGFQIVQEAADRVTVRAVRGNETREGLESEIAEGFGAIHPQLRCRVEWVDAIAPDSSGKMKKVLSKVKPPRAAGREVGP